MEVKIMNNTYIDYLKAMHKSENTIKSYITHINEMLSIIGKPESEIKYVDLLEWMKKISSNSPATINLKISSVKSYFKYLKKIGVISSNPALELEKVKNNPKEKQYVSSEDMKNIIKNMYTAEGKAIVASLNMLKMIVRVKIDDKNGGWLFKDYPASELTFKKNNPQKEKEVDEDEEE